MAQSFVQIDAFADRPFTGNPAAVCLLESPRSDEWMQAIASERNLSETAFLERRDNGFGLRWFTPRIEVDLCGHATLASAHYLWEAGHLNQGDTAVFHTKSGELTATKEDGWIVLDFPALSTEPLASVPDVEAALGVKVVAAARCDLDILAEVESEAILRALRPNISAIAEIETRGVIVTARGDDEFDFVSRFFIPRDGIPEDPVTGFAHCVLTPYWSLKLGKSHMLAYHASARAGTLRVSLVGDRVQLGGPAVTVLEGPPLSPTLLTAHRHAAAAAGAEDDAENRIKPFPRPVCDLRHGKAVSVVGEPDRAPGRLFKVLGEHLADGTGRIGVLDQPAGR